GRFLRGKTSTIIKSQHFNFPVSKSAVPENRPYPGVGKALIKLLDVFVNQVVICGANANGSGGEAPLPDAIPAPALTVIDASALDVPEHLIDVVIAEELKPILAHTLVGNQS